MHYRLFYLGEGIGLATILMGWELGEGLGHVQRLLRIGRALAAEGHRPVFALCNVVEPWPLFQRDDFAVLPAPTIGYRPRGGAKSFLASSLADVLAVRGWGNVETLLPLVEAWRHLLDQIKPALIVADYAPTLCLAAYRECPLVQVGNWFPMPPVDKATFPLLVPGQAPVMPQAELLAIVQEVQQRRGKPIPATLTGVLAEGDRFPVFLAELDPYQSMRNEPVWDPLEPLPPPTDVVPERGFFAYLTADNPNVEAYLTQMALTGCPGTVYLRAAPGDLKERLRLQGLTVLDEPAQFEEMLAKSAVIVHHGGSSANSAFAVGRPQILFPQHLEQITTAQALSKLGVAICQLSNAAPEGAGRALQQVLSDPRYGDNARRWARRVQERSPRPGLPAILECCRHHLGNVTG